jgi:hypothetical protein
VLDVLSGLLYFYIELPKGVHTAIYADDLVLWCTEEYAATANCRMQIALDNVVTCAEQWCVTVTIICCSSILSGVSSKVSLPSWILGESVKRVPVGFFLCYLYNRRARVLVDEQCGRKVLLKQGVPQGGVLPLTLSMLVLSGLLYFYIV